MSSRWLVAALAVIMTFAFTMVVQGHSPSEVSITGEASPECRDPDEGWQVQWRLSVDSDAGPFDIVDTEPTDLSWDGTQVQPGSSALSGVNYSASVSKAQITVEHTNRIPDHGTRFYHSEEVKRPPLCEEPTVTPTATATSTTTSTATPEPTATPVPTEVPPLDLCQNIEGIQTSVPAGLEWSNFDCEVPEPEPTKVVTPQGSITPPSTGNGGLVN